MVFMLRRLFEQPDDGGDDADFGARYRRARFEKSRYLRKNEWRARQFVQYAVGVNERAKLARSAA